MMCTVMVKRDGFAMPLYSFIDCYRMVRIDRFALPAIAGDARLMTVDASGVVHEDCRANQIDLRDVLAFRPIEGQQELQACIDCGTSNDESDVCDDCHAERSWDW
ncbi:hypothetical protein [Sphingobium limneticum]|uniref:Uncharacterized protein n=1 Tax=Sphingobium limneticum TaxID=1007511 RepID=A0A5J5I8D4_9SPHN|nr:hypothetical protein [Sphingobium limneticum]KAA9020759.1 hypothetical protein F4U96_03585 [Sphingobium limneticum]KAA9033085.1 hypothetical protein F4U95_03585 [Sphingobium limneticum]